MERVGGAKFYIALYFMYGHAHRVGGTSEKIRHQLGALFSLRSVYRLLRLPEILEALPDLPNTAASSLQPIGTIPPHLHDLVLLRLPALVAYGK